MKAVHHRDMNHLVGLNPLVEAVWVSRVKKWLTPQANRLLKHLFQAGSISAREAIIDLDMTSATLARRICDLESVGIPILRVRMVHPTTGKRYTRYAISVEEA